MGGISESTTVNKRGEGGGRERERERLGEEGGRGETHGGSIYNSGGGVRSACRGVLCVSRVCAFAFACRAAETFLSLFFFFARSPRLWSAHAAGGPLCSSFSSAQVPSHEFQM